MLKIPDNVKVWLISDTHFNHANIIEYSKRPFKSVDEMNEAIIANWNSTVGDSDLVLHLGDWFMGQKHLAPAIMKRLSGRKILVKGNHDKMFTRYPDLESQLEASHEYLEVSHRGDCAALFHMPIESWNNAHRGWFHLHGHSHGTSRTLGRRLDVGVDAFCNGFTPRSWQEVAKELNGRVFEQVDHHDKDTLSP
jgi:calcineurin-like phosphoesterase family protein